VKQGRPYEIFSYRTFCRPKKSTVIMAGFGSGHLAFFFFNFVMREPNVAGTKLQECI
jgi:hypothetical protein